MSSPPTPDPSAKGLPSWLILMIAVVVPPVSLIPFARSIIQSPLLIALVVVLYVVIVFIVGLFAKIWQKPESVLVDHFSVRATLWLQAMLSRYRKLYCEQLTYEHQVFDVKGLSTRTAHDLELEQVFVELSLDSTPAHQASADPLSVPANLREGEHTIWDYLSSSTSLGNPHLVIIEAPGSGKTTLLKHIALTLAQQKKRPQLANLSQALPLLLFLRDQVSSLQNNPDFSLVDAVQNHIQRKWHSSIPSSWIEHYLAQGKCLVLLEVWRMWILSDDI